VDRYQKTGLYSLLAAMLILTACSVQEHYSTLSIFFDGVPNPDEAKLLTADSTSTSSAISTSIEQNEMPEFFVHLPYRDKECASCHDKGSMGNLTRLEPGLCYQCHTRLQSKHIFEHGPVAGGYCSQCHHPHRTKEENLLLRSGEDLCLQCHNNTEVSESIFHNISDESDCIVCHNPHGSENQSLLRRGACYQCHENFSANYIVVHGPIAADLCSSCHTSHHEGSDKHLIKADQDLCLYCHDAERIFENEKHPRIEDTFCIDCHNPHVSGKKINTY